MPERELDPVFNRINTAIAAANNVANTNWFDKDEMVEARTALRIHMKTLQEQVNVLREHNNLKTVQAL